MFLRCMWRGTQWKNTGRQGFFAKVKCLKPMKCKWHSIHQNFHVILYSWNLLEFSLFHCSTNPVFWLENWVMFYWIYSCIKQKWIRDLLILCGSGITGEELEGNGCIIRNGEKYEQPSEDCCAENQGWKILTLIQNALK